VKDELVCEVTRGKRVESAHRGAIAVVEDAKLVYRRGAIDEPVYLRSAAKPIQAFTVLESGAADAYGLEAAEISVMAGSHPGEPEQVAAAASILRKAGVEADALRCGVHPPGSARALRELHASGLEPGVLHNNCSGKHAGMLAAAKHSGWPLDSYLSPQHPLQKANLKNVGDFASLRARRIVVATDGCSAPTFALPLASAARAIAVFAQAGGSARRVREAMMAHPMMVGRPCGALMSAAPGRILGKIGAEGVYVCALPARGAGIALKVSDGNARAIPVLLAAIFRKLKLLSKADLAAVDRMADPVLKNHAGVAVGELRPLV
jgi:L-asparaginase II